MPSEQAIDRMDTVHGHVPHEDSLNRRERILDCFIDLGEAEWNSEEPEATRLPYPPASGRRRSHEIVRHPPGYRQLQRRNVDTAAEDADEDETLEPKASPALQ